MNPENEWDARASTGSAVLGDGSMGAVRIALLFGSAAVALALIIAPIAAGRSGGDHSRTTIGADLDTMSTGSIGQGTRYTIRKSVLQSAPNAICIIRDNGMRSGDCN
jgi:hypothetical protein